MSAQISRIEETLRMPDRIVSSKTDKDVELFYRTYRATPVGEKFLCVVTKSARNDCFIITAYFTDSMKKGKILWIKK